MKTNKNAAPGNCLLRIAWCFVAYDSWLLLEPWEFRHVMKFNGTLWIFYAKKKKREFGKTSGGVIITAAVAVAV